MRDADSDEDETGLYRDETYDEEFESPYDRDVYADAEDEDSLWDEGLISLLLVAGVVLFLIPEPATSTIGIALVALGAVAWAADALT